MKNVINLDKMLSASGNYKSREYNTEEEYSQKILSDRKYLERRMYSELTDIYRNIKLKDNIDLPKNRETSLYTKVSRDGHFNSDTLIVIVKGKKHYVKNRLSMSKKRFDECFEDLFEFITHIVTISQYGVFIDGLGHIYCKGFKFVVSPFYIVGSGNKFKNLVQKVGEKTINKIDKARRKGQKYSGVKSIKQMYSHFNRVVLPKISLDYLDLKERNTKHLIANK